MDLLAFKAVAQTVVAAVFDDSLDPLAIGVSGHWGSGKTTVLRLIEQDLKQPLDPESEQRVLVVNADPWRFDPTVGAKESLIAAVLDTVGAELKSAGGAKGEALAAVKRLAKRVDWAKAVKIVAQTSLTLQLPSIDDITSLVREGDGGDEGVKGLEAFREEFARLMAMDGLADIKRVVVLVDDLDRCLPEAVIETLETIRLFLAVPKMSFVLAADEDRVADAIRTRYPQTPLPSDATGALPEEEAAKLYLHKIVQTTVPLPALSRFDTQAYLLLLQLSNRAKDPITQEQFTEFLDRCTNLRLKSGDLDEIAGLGGVDVSEELAFAARLTPILYEKLRGNPRRIKRFLNDLSVREAIAARRGIELEMAVIAKLMVLEQLLPTEFAKVLEWLANGALRDRIAVLESLARRPGEATGADVSPDGAKESNGKARSASSSTKSQTVQGPVAEGDFSDNFIRWAKLPPELATLDLSPYLHLAASFAGAALLDRELPARLRDLAANLLSSVRAEQKSVEEADLKSLTSGDAASLLQHLGRMARDRPIDQRRAVNGILRIFRAQPAQSEQARQALLSIPANDVGMPSVLLFSLPDDSALRPVLEHWKTASPRQQVKNAVDEVLKKGGT
ncbi:MAG: KAP family P-loop NTPase fold protein [Candidatus Dormibacteraceae bacterium]